MAIEPMDGRKRGQILRGTDGKFTTRQKWNENVQKDIDKYYQDIARRKKFMDQNPDLKVLNDADMARIQDLEKEKQLVNNSRRGIKDRVQNYREAMEKQGLKGQQLEEQVARYKDGLIAKRKERFNELKGQNNARIKAQKTVVPEKPGALKGKFIKNLKKAGKWGAILVAVGAVVYGLAKSCSGKKTDASQVPQPEQPSKPVVPEQQLEQPQTATVQNGDTFKDIADRYETHPDSIIAYNEEKLHDYHNAKDASDDKIYKGFEVGEDITLPKTARQTKDAKEKNKADAVKDYEEYVIKNLEQFPRARWNELCTEDFRKKHQIGEYKKAA